MPLNAQLKVVHRLQLGSKEGKTTNHSGNKTMGYLDKSAKTEETQDLLKAFFKPKVWKLPDFDLSNETVSSNPQWLGIACEITFYFAVLSEVPKNEQSPIDVLQYAYGFSEKEITLCTKDIEVLVSMAWKHAAWRIPQKKKSVKNPPFEKQAIEYLKKKYIWFKKIVKGTTKCDPRFFKLGGDAIILKNGKWEVIEIKNDSSSARKNAWVNQALLLFLKKYYESVIKVDQSVFWVPFYFVGDPVPRKPAPVKNKAEKLFAHCISEDAIVSIVCPRPEVIFSFSPLKEIRKTEKKSKEDPFRLAIKYLSKSF